MVCVFLHQCFCSLCGGKDNLGFIFLASKTGFDFSLTLAWEMQVTLQLCYSLLL